MNRVKLFFTRTLPLFLAVFGPATIAAVADNDAAGVTTYSIAGAKFGYSILFILMLITFLLAVTQEIGIRIGIVTGKGFADIIRERYGIKVAILVFVMLFIANVGNVITDMSALKATGIMFGIPIIPFVLIVIVFCFIFVTQGNYEANQKIFLVGIFLYVAYIFSAFKAQPHWPEALKSIVYPTGLKLTREYVITAVAVLGTTITPWGQFFIQSFVNDKKLTLDKLKFSQIETYFGAFFTNFFSFFMVVATAATLYIHNIPLDSGERAALAIKPFAGELAGVLFGVGLINAAIMGVVIISLSTAYAFSEFFGYEGSLDTAFNKGRLFYFLFLIQLLIAAGVILIPGISLFTIVVITQFINASMLPVIFYFLLKISNDKEIMGENVNSKWYNYVLIVASIVIIIAALFTAVTIFIT
jgi:Mn2+/Fe2+ NRAMP family transporter